MNLNWLWSWWSAKPATASTPVRLPARPFTPTPKTKAQEVLSAVPAPVATVSAAVRHTSEKGLAIIKEFEGFKAKAYLCPAGIWTIGYGHTSAAGGLKVTKGLVITKAEAEALLDRDVIKYEIAVSKHVKVTLTQDEFDALVSFCYNIGETNFANSSVVKYINSGRKHLVGSGLAMWVKGGGKRLPGLVRRRSMEADLFYSKQ
jgi:lysozyme